MSIAVNNTQLQDLEPDHPFHAVYKTCTDWIKKHFQDEYIEFDFPKELIIPPTGEQGSRETYPQTLGDVPVHLYTTPDMSVEVRYFTQSQIKGDSLVFTQPVRVDLGRRAVSRVKNLDLLFWLMFVNPYFDPKGLPNEVQKYVNLVRDPQRHFVLVDLKKEAIQAVEEERIITRAKELLFGSSAISGAKLDNIAATFNVSNIAGKTPEMVLSDLNKILFLPNEKGKMKIDTIKDFIRMADGKGEAIGIVLEHGKLAATLLERGILKKFKPDPDKGISRQCVYMVDEKGEPVEHICDLRPGMQHIQAVSEALAAKKDLLGYLEARLKG